MHFVLPAMACESRQSLMPLLRGCPVPLGWIGELSIADILYVPLALRFATYAIPVSAQGTAFAAAVDAWPAVQAWIEAARQETEAIDFIDQLVPADASPLTLG